MWNELFGAKRSEFCLYVGESMATVHDLLMLAGLTMRGGQKRKEGRKEECHTFHYLIQIVSLGDKNRTHKGGLNSANSMTGRRATMLVYISESKLTKKMEKCSHEALQACITSRTSNTIEHRRGMKTGEVLKQRERDGGGAKKKNTPVY